MKAITNIKLKVSRIEAIKTLADYRGMLLTERINLVDDMCSLETYEFEDEDILYVLRDLFTFDVIKTKDEICDEIYQAKRKERYDVANAWYESLSEENKVHVQTLQSYMVATG